MITAEIRETAIKLNINLIESLNNEELQALENFGINPDILEEIEEILTENEIVLEKDKLIVDINSFNIFEYNEKGFGIEIRLKTENNTKLNLTLHTELHTTETSYQLKYRLIELM